MLYQIDQTGISSRELFPQFWAALESPEAIQTFAEQLVLGVIAQREELDKMINNLAKHWRIERMAVVDRNVLRIAAWELLHHAETPPVVAIDEAIEVAKRFGSADSGKFINGILEGIRERLNVSGPLDTGAGTD